MGLPVSGDYDISAICADIRKKQAESGRKTVSLIKNKSKENIDMAKAA